MSTVWAELKEHRVTAEPGIEVVRLGFMLVCTGAPGVQPERGWELRGTLRVGLPNSSPRYLARCYTERPFWFRDGQRAEGMVHVEVTPGQIEEIEEIRAGGSLQFLLDFSMSAVSDGDDDMSFLDGHQSHLNVSPAYWSQALASAGAAEDFLLVVPAPPPTADRKLIEAWKTWQKARDATVGGRWDDAVLATRKVVDLLGYNSEPDGKPDAKPRYRTKAERWQSLGYALYRLASAPGHGDEVTIEMVWTRDDAIGAVAASGGLLRGAICALRPQ